MFQVWSGEAQILKMSQKKKRKDKENRGRNCNASHIRKGIEKEVEKEFSIYFMMKSIGTLWRRHP